MKTSVAVLSFSFFCVCVAEVSTTVSQTKEAACPAACHTTKSQQGNVQPNGVLEELEARLATAEKQLEDLRNAIQGSHVAFGAALGDVGYVGPIPAETTLIYKNVYANTGAYDPETGIFTAPVSGFYYFSITGHTLSSNPMGLRLMKNARQMATVRSPAAGEHYETLTNSMILQLHRFDQAK